MASLIGAYCQTTESSSGGGSIGGLFILLFLAFIIYKAKSISSTSRSKKRKKAETWPSINNLNSIFNPSFNSINAYSNNPTISHENKYISKYNAKRNYNNIRIGNDYPVNWQELRQEVLERDGYICKNCGAKDSLHVHHIVPKSKGGGHHLDNLATLCFNCHAKSHPHMEHMIKTKSYHSPEKEGDVYGKDISTLPVFNAKHNVNFCKECGARLHEIDNKDLGDRTLKVYQCEFCGAIHNKSFLKKRPYDFKYPQVPKKDNKSADLKYCRNCGNELYLSDTEKFEDLMIKSFECPKCKSIYKKRYRKKTTL
ncbi:MAG TPA: HNH endonuclease [Candidatus Methanofastidiosum sp.]|nr:HNH endonuclease [Methanofastidiosum sp.]